MSYARQAIVLIAGTLCSSAVASAIVQHVLAHRYDVDLRFAVQSGWWAGGFLAVVATAAFSRSRPYALVGYVMGCALVAVDWRMYEDQVFLTDVMPPYAVEWSVRLLTDCVPLVFACVGLALAQDNYTAVLGIGKNPTTGRVRARWPLALWIVVFVLIGVARWRIATYQPDLGREAAGYGWVMHVVYCRHSSECKLAKNATYCGKCSTTAFVDDESACKLPANASCACISGQCERADLKRAP